jgi:hypothetical protein
MLRINPRVARLTCVAALLVIRSFGASNTPRPQEAEAVASRFLAQRLQVWQERMNLKDWNIQVRIVRADQLEPKTVGNVHWDVEVKTATVSVLRPADYKLPFQPMLDDMEFTIVHELVHLELASLPRSEASRGTEERAVNEIARALMKLAPRKF